MAVNFHSLSDMNTVSDAETLASLEKSLLLDDIAPQIPDAVSPEFFSPWAAPVMAPQVETIREVLQGKRYRTKIHYQGADFHFFHGCLMVQVNYEGKLVGLPPMDWDAKGQPVLQVLPEHQQKWLDEFLSLPKHILVFYFGMMKDLFGAKPLQGRVQDPKTGQQLPVGIPHNLKALISEVNWPVAA